jgi:hypothetical protein
LFFLQDLDATSFIKAEAIKRSDFHAVSELLIDCYSQIINNEIFKPNEFENHLRNVLIGYLRKNKEKHGISYLGFEIEVGEIGSDYGTIGFLDIKVSNIGLLDSMKCDESIYYAIECKRLDNSKKKISDYINEGILRYVIMKYSRNMPIAFMIGFIESGQVINIINNINNDLSSHKIIETIQYLKQFQFYDDFEYSYQSIHNRIKNQGQIELVHLMFDYSSIIIKNT